MRRRSTYFSLLVTLVFAAASCVDDAAPSEPESGSRLGLDETVPCPEGEVGWRFPTTPLDPNSEEYIQRSGNSEVVEITQRFAIEVQSAACGNSTSETNPLRNECGGELTCRYSTSCSSLSVSFTCGASDKNADGSQKTYSATSSNGVVEFGCSQPARETVEVETRTACVPRQCHGRTRRNLDMQCVEAPDIPEVVMKGGFNTTYEGFNGVQVDFERYPIRDRYTPIQGDDFYTSRDFNGELIFPTNEYRIDLWADFWFGLVPELSTITAWMSDTYKKNDTGESVEAFRCVAFKRDVETDEPYQIDDDVRFAMSYEGKISTDCTEGGRVSEDTAAKKLGLSVTEFRQQYSYFNTKLRASYDVEGNTVWHRVQKFRYAFQLEDLTYHEPECAPNPQDFYYDSTTGTYDLMAYYAQREFAEPRELQFVEPSVGRQAYILPGKILPRGALTIRTNSRLNASLPVDISWDTANLTDENPFNPFATGVDVGGAWDPGKSLPASNYGPKNLKASIYTFPLGRSDNTSRYYAYKIGEIPLEGPNPEGTTQSANLPITENIKRYFTWPSSENYIEGDSRLFQIFYCIESDDDPRHANDAFKVKTGNEYYVPNNGADFAVRPYTQNYALSETSNNPAAPPYALILDTDNDARRARARRGCRTSSRPLRVNIDRFTTPLEPVSAAGFTGTTNNESTGDDKMSGSNDNDNEVNCMGAAQENCVEAVNSGNRTDGESARSTYSIDSRLGRNPGDEANSSMTAEMVGFQLIDPMDPETSSVSFPADSASASSTPVTITLAPDWDGIKSALERASTGSATQWETGRYGGQMGLGVGWGYKWRFQIGPAPVVVTFTFSVGASVKVTAEFQFAPGAGQAYPCLGSQSCVVKVDTPATLRDAARQCNVRGGRLAELSSAAEANAVDAQRGGDEVWLGAQLAYRHAYPSCATNFVASECLPRSKTEYRWMSNSTAFASNGGEATPTYASGTIFNATQAGLSTAYPRDRGVVYRANGTLGAVDVNVQKPYLCAYDPAERERFFRWQLGLDMGAAAGFRLEGCTPSDNPGFCLAASFNVVAFNIGPKYENIYHWLYRAGETAPYSRRGNTNLSVPWSLNLFQGAVTAAVNFLWFSITWNLVTYDGITAAEGLLYNSDTPVIESLE